MDERSERERYGLLPFSFSPIVSGVRKGDELNVKDCFASL